MTAPTEVKVPDIGDFDAVPIIEIHVGVGDQVNAEDPLVTLESDKATLDVPAPAAGSVAELLVKVGDEVSEGSPILMLTPATARITAPPSLVEQQEPSPAAPAPTPAAEPAGGPAAAPAHAAAARGADTPAAAGLTRRPVHTPGRACDGPPASWVSTWPRSPPPGRRGASPRTTCWPSSRARPSRPPRHPPRPAGSGIPEIPAQDFSKFGPVETVKLSRIKKVSGPFLHRSWLNVPHVTHNDEADITDLDRYRKELDTAAKNEKNPYRVTLLAFLVKACVAALKKFPEFNSSLSPEKDALILKQYYNIGIAVDTPGGLVVPVVKDADRKGIVELSREFMAISGKARDGKLGPSDMAGGTFTISSLGGIGGTSFTPIVNAPEVAILGVVRSKMSPVWNGTEFTARNMLPLSLSFDHRVVDGALAARFARHLCYLLEDDRRLLL